MALRSRDEISVQRVTCNLCQEEDLTWVTSKRTGRRYLCDTGYSFDGSTIIALAHMPHFCPEIEKRRAEQMEQDSKVLDTDGQQEGTDPDYEGEQAEYAGPETSEVDEPGNDELMAFVQLDADELDEAETIAAQAAAKKQRRGAKAKLDADE